MCGKPFDQPPAFYAAYSGAPLVLCESFRQPCSKGIRGIAPEIFAVVPAVHILVVIERFNRNGVLAVRQPHQNAGEAQPNVFGIFAFTEGLPSNIGVVIEYLGQIARTRQFCIGFPIEHFRTGGGNKRRMSGGRHIGHLFQKFDVLGAAPEFIVADHCAIGLAAENAEFLVVNFLEDVALIKLRGLLKVFQKLVLRDVENLDLQHRGGFSL